MSEVPRLFSTRVREARSILRFAALAATAGCGASAQNEASSPVAYHLVRPGDAELSVRRVRDTVEHTRYLSRAATGDTTEHELGAMTTEEHAMSDARGPAILLIRGSSSAKFAFSDTLYVRVSGLRPEWEHLHGGTTNLELAYDGATVHRRALRTDSAPSVAEKVLPEPAFAFNELDLVIRSLPLAAGYSAIVPLYSEIDSALELDSVRVVEPAQPSAWTVRFADPAIVATYTIDRRTRETIAYSVLQRRTGNRLRLVSLGGDR